MMLPANITMERFAEAIRSRPGLQGPGSPVPDSTGLEGGWDFTLSWSYARGPDAANVEGDPMAASDPSGGLTIVEALFFCCAG